MYSLITDKRLKYLFIVLASASFLDGLSTSIINNILPVITETYSIGLVNSSWITQAYFLTLVVFLLPFAKIADNGRIREVYFIGQCLFCGGLILCACAPSFNILLLARLIQGLGAAMAAGSCPAIIARLIPSSKYGFSIGFTLGAASLAIAVGPLLGGFIASLVSWHWAFLVCLPVSALVAVIAYFILPKADKIRSKQKFDVIGTILFIILIASFILFQDSVPVLSINNIIMIGYMVIFAVSLLLFILHSLHCKNPLINIRIFTQKGFAAVAFSFLFLCATFGGMMFLIPYYMQAGLDLDPGLSGLLLMLPALLAAVIATPVGMWADKSGNRTPCILASSCYCVLCAFFVFINPVWGIPALVFGLVFVGLSYGIMGGPSSARIIHCARDEDKSQGASVVMLFNYLGSAIGIAAFTVAIAFIVPSSMGTALDELPLNSFMLAFHVSAFIGLLFSVASLILTIAVSSKTVK